MEGDLFGRKFVNSVNLDLSDWFISKSVLHVYRKLKVDYMMELLRLADPFVVGSWNNEVDRLHFYDRMDEIAMLYSGGSDAWQIDSNRHPKHKII